jgi:hypothetical protein
MLKKFVLRCTVCFALALLLVAWPASAEAQHSVVVTGPDEGYAPEVRAFNSSTGDYIFCAFLAYPRSFTGGVRVATGDVNGDGVADIITAPGPGMGPHVRIFDGNTCRRMRGQQGDFLAYRANFQGGVFVAAGDVNGDGRADIITGPGAGGRPVVRVFDGLTGNMIQSFLAYDSSFRGGVHVAAGDVDGDQIADIITGPGGGGAPLVKVFSPVGPTLLTSFPAYPSNFLGGVFVAAGDVNNDGFDDIVTGPGAGGSPQVKVFDAHHNLMLLRSFFAFAPMFTGGVHVAIGDFNQDGTVDSSDLIVGAGPGGGPHVKIFSLLNNTVLQNFFAYPNFTGGVFVAGFNR